MQAKYIALPASLPSELNNNNNQSIRSYVQIMTTELTTI